MSVSGLRFGTQENKHGRPARFVARDVSTGGCEHAVWRDGKLWWLPHPQGGHMEPFTGPDEKYEEITRGGKELWDWTTAVTLSGS